jgi:hypothetical protein
MGKLAGVKALSDVSNGKPIDPAMKAAVQDVEKAQAGDPVASEKIAAMQAQSAEKVPAAIKYMVAVTGAAVVARALANNPVAQEEWKEKAGIAPRSNTENDPVIVDAEIVVPGMSSLPDEPLPPVRGVVGFFKAALSALTLATKDPFQNYREGIASRARRLGPVSSSGDAKLYKSLDADGATTAAHDKLVASTKTRLQTLVNAATAGDKKSQAKWETAKANYSKAKARASKGDTKSKDVVSVLEATGLFS